MLVETQQMSHTGSILTLATRHDNMQMHKFTNAQFNVRHT